MKIEVLVAAMHQKDLSRPAEMNIATDVIVESQCDWSSNEEHMRDGYRTSYCN